MEGWRKLNFNISIKEDVINLLKIYNIHQSEVGGMIFGIKKFNKYILMTLSFKKGKSTSINFSNNDKIIYQPPEKQRIIGTWHLHPMQLEANPSIIDLQQWKSWGKKYIHIICTKKDFKIFNSKGECLYGYFFEEM